MASLLSPTSSSAGGEPPPASALERREPAEFYVRAHAGVCKNVTAASECEAVLADLVQCCEEAAMGGESTPFQHNEHLQSLLEAPPSHFVAVGEAGSGWDRRRTAVRRFFSSFHQRATSAVAATIQHRDAVSSAGGFTRRRTPQQQPEGVTFVAIADGLYLHLWHHASECRRFLLATRSVWQVAFEHGLRMLRSPITCPLMFRCQLFTVTALCPILPAPLTGAPAVADSVFLRHEANVLRFGLAAHGGTPTIPDVPSLGLRRASDGRCYAVSTAWRTPAFHPTMNSDASVFLRPEAGAVPGGFASTRAYIIEQQCAAAGEELHGFVAGLDSATKAVSIAVKDNTVTTVLHRHGVNMRFLGHVLKAIPGSTLVAKAARGLVKTEMVFRAVKGLLRGAMAASSGDDLDQLSTVNDVWAGIVNPNTDMWQGAVLPVMRAKFELAADYKVALSAALLRAIAAHMSARLGMSLDKETLRITGMNAARQRPVLFEAPVEAFAASGDRPLGPDVAMSVTSRSYLHSSHSSSSTTSSQQRDEDYATRSMNEGSVSSRRRRGSRVSVSFAPEPERETRSDLASLISEGRDDPDGSPPPTAATPTPLAAVLERNANAREDAFDAIEAANVPRASDAAALLRCTVLGRLLASPTADRDRRQAADLAGARDAKRLGMAAALQIHLLLLGDSLRTVEARDVSDTMHRVLARTALVEPPAPPQARHHGRRSPAARRPSVDSGGLVSVDDLPYVCRAFLAAARSLGDVSLMATGFRELRRVPWVVPGLVTEHFNGLIQAAAGLTVHNDAHRLRDVVIEAAAAAPCIDQATRRQQLLSTVRKVTTALVSSRVQPSCRTLLRACRVALPPHVVRYGLADTQTSIAFAQCVYVCCEAQAHTLCDDDAATLHKYHYFAASMGALTVEGLHSQLNSEPYNEALGAILRLLLPRHPVVAVSAFRQHRAFLGPSPDVGDAGAMTVTARAAVEHWAAQRIVRMMRGLDSENNLRFQLARRLEEDRVWRIGFDHMERWRRALLRCRAVEHRQLVGRRLILGDEAGTWAALRERMRFVAPRCVDGQELMERDGLSTVATSFTVDQPDLQPDLGPPRSQPSPPSTASASSRDTERSTSTRTSRSATPRPESEVSSSEARGPDGSPRRQGSFSSTASVPALGDTNRPTESPRSGRSSDAPMHPPGPAHGPLELPLYVAGPLAAVAEAAGEALATAEAKERAALCLARDACQVDIAAAMAERDEFAQQWLWEARRYHGRALASHELLLEHSAGCAQIFGDEDAARLLVALEAEGSCERAAHAVEESDARSLLALRLSLLCGTAAAGDALLALRGGGAADMGEEEALQRTVLDATAARLRVMAEAEREREALVEAAADSHTAALEQEGYRERHRRSSVALFSHGMAHAALERQHRDHIEATEEAAWGVLPLLPLSHLHAMGQLWEAEGAARHALLGGEAHHHRVNSVLEAEGRGRATTDEAEHEAIVALRTHEEASRQVRALAESALCLPRDTAGGRRSPSVASSAEYSDDLEASSSLGSRAATPRAVQEATVGEAPQDIASLKEEPPLEEEPDEHAAPPAPEDPKEATPDPTPAASPGPSSPASTPAPSECPSPPPEPAPVVEHSWNTATTVTPPATPPSSPLRLVPGTPPTLFSSRAATPVAPSSLPPIDRTPPWATPASIATPPRLATPLALGTPHRQPLPPLSPDPTLPEPGLEHDTPESSPEPEAVPVIAPGGPLEQEAPQPKPKRRRRLPTAAATPPPPMSVHRFVNGVLRGQQQRVSTSMHNATVASHLRPQATTETGRRYTVAGLRTFPEPATTPLPPPPPRALRRIRTLLQQTGGGAAPRTAHPSPSPAGKRGAQGSFLPPLAKDRPL